MDVGAVSTGYSTAQVTGDVAIAMLKKTMDSTEEIASQIVNQLLNVNVGFKQESLVDMYV